jgi:hypothetical protein
MAPIAQVDGVLGEVGVAHDDVQAAVLLAVGMGLVPGIDDGTLDHGVQRDLGLEEVGSLGDLVVDRLAAVLCAHLARAAVDLPSDEEGHQLLDDLLEGRAPVHQVVLVRAVAVALSIAVVLVDEHLRALGQERIGLPPARLEDQLARLLVHDQVAHVRHLG